MKGSTATLLTVLALTFSHQQNVLGQQESPLQAAVAFARAELVRQGVDTTGIGPAFEPRQLQAMEHDRRDEMFAPAWSENVLKQMHALGLHVASLDDVQTCGTLGSGKRSCHLRPYHGLVIASAPNVQGAEATVSVQLWFQTGKTRTHPHTKEPFEVIHVHAFDISLRRTHGGWEVAGRTKGVLSTYVY